MLLLVTMSMLSPGQEGKVQYYVSERRPVLCEHTKADV